MDGKSNPPSISVCFSLPSSLDLASFLPPPLPFMPSFLFPFICPLSKKTNKDRPSSSCPQEILSYCVGWGCGWGWGVLADMALDSTCFSWTFIVAFWRTERFRKNILLFSWISLFNITLKNKVSPLWIFLHKVKWCRLRGQKTRQTGPRVQRLPLEKIHTGYDPCVSKSNLQWVEKF